MSTEAGSPLRRRMIEDMTIRQFGDRTSVITSVRFASSRSVIPISPKGDKIVRAAAQSARIEGGQVFLPSEAPWLYELQREVLAFPSVPHDDQVDSISQFLNWAVTREYDVPRIRSFDD